MQTGVLELTVEELHKRIREGTMSCTQLVETYLERIRIYDQSTRLNSMVVINPKAVEQAKALDMEYIRTLKLRPLHGVPIIVKDNYDTHDLQTSAGSLAMKGSLPPDDSFQVRKLRKAGAVVLGKSNMAEWAFSPYITESSITGTTRNPYDLERVPAGSSGGTAAAVAANLGLLGLGTDTGNSIRGPSSHCCLVGVRSTIGLTSRDGIVPLYLRNDVGGPMCRTVKDAAKVLNVTVGCDPTDPATALSKGKAPKSYTTQLTDDARARALRELESVYSGTIQTSQHLIRRFLRSSSKPLVI
jgi:Asp-tRNA(Asn)/Glu-tRNA(Gln) amidotransferase A subunit family amidase